jgi:dipeptidyl aminopeptidase/acylaminoacyl peptidase
MSLNSAQVWWARCLLATSFFFTAWVQAAGLAQLPQFDDLDLSPDGSKLILVRAHDDVYDLVVREIHSESERTLYVGGGKNGLLNWCRWGNETRIICSVRHYLPAPRLGFITRTRMFAVNVDGSDFVRLVPRAKNRDRWPAVFNAQVQDRVISWLTDDPQHILIQLNRSNANRPGVYRLNIYTNRLARVQKPRANVRRWYATHEGQVRLAIGYRDEREPVVYYVNGRQLREYKDPVYKSEIPPQPIGFSADQQSVYMSMTNGEDRHGMYRVDLATGRVLQTLHTDPQFDVFGTVILHPETGQPAGVNYLAHHPRLVFSEPKLQALFAHIGERLPGTQMALISTDFAYDHFVLRAYGGIAPRYYLYQRNTDQIRLIGADYPALADAEVADLQAVQYQTRDGLQIPAYLATPKSPGPHPTVLLPHGGPYARDSAEFDAWVQYLVGHGIAVLKPNYRGSVGYGEAYMQAGYKQWGLKMQEDLMDGLSWLVANGVADPDRVCVVGASYGGYTALVSAYKFADQIQCAVSLAGITDLEEMVSRLYNFDLVRRNRERIQASADLANNSPLRQVANIQVPVLLFHGTRDTVVRVKQSRELAQALAEHDKSYEYVEQVGGDHFLSSNSQRAEFFAEMSAFLTEHLLARHPRVQ